MTISEADHSEHVREYYYRAPLNIDLVTEYAANDGKRIDWKHWLSLPFWEPQEAVFLLNLYDPQKPPANPARKIDLDKITELGEREQQVGILPTNVTPAAWVAWAKKNDITVPSQFAGLGAWTEAATDTTTPCDNIPGKMPKTAIGKLAIKAAWEIEYQTGKRATSQQVIEKLQKWEPDEPVITEKIAHGVKWETTKGKTNNYDIQTCAKTLETWNRSRA